MADKKQTYGKTAFVIIVLCSGLFLGVLLFIAQDNTQQPDTAPRQDMLENAQFRGMPPQKLDGAKRAIAALLQACPNIPKYAAHGENLTVDYYPNGWEGTSAHLDVELDLAPDSLKALPQGLRALLEIRYDRFSRGFERDSKAGCGRQHNEAAWPELHARRNAIRLI